MVLSDALVEEIFQVLIRLPYNTVEQLIIKMRQEVAVQMNQVQNPNTGVGVQFHPPMNAGQAHMQRVPEDIAIKEAANRADKVIGEIANKSGARRK